MQSQNQKKRDLITIDLHGLGPVLRETAAKENRTTGNLILTVLKNWLRKAKGNG
jgi:hypothetical protein